MPTHVETWLAPKELSSLIPEWCYSTVLRLAKRRHPQTGEPLLRVYRPSPGRILISRESALSLRQAISSSPDFWTNGG